MVNRKLIYTNPNDTLALIAYLLKASEGTTLKAREAGADLDETCQVIWDDIQRGDPEPSGFAKAKHALAWSYYQCRAVHHARGERVCD